MQSQFKNIDLKRKRTKPFVATFVIKRMVEENPDLSHLTGHLGGQEYAEQDDARLEEYNKGNWCMMGIRAECQYLIPDNTVPPSAVIQTLTSGGLWGIESDSDDKYIKQVEREQLNELKEYCDKLGIKYSKKTPVQRQDN